MSTIEPFFILKRAPYRENQYLLDIFSASQGKLRASAYIARIKQYRNHDALSPFHLLTGELKQKNDWITLQQVEIHTRCHLTGQSYLNACYINELLLQLLPPHFPTPSLFEHYQHCIHQPDALALRTIELALITELDCLPEIQETSEYYYLDQSQEPARFIPATQGYPRAALLALKNGQLPDNFHDTRNLLQTILATLPQSKTLRTKNASLSLHHLLHSPTHLRKPNT